LRARLTREGTSAKKNVNITKRDGREKKRRMAEERGKGYGTTGKKSLYASHSNKGIGEESSKKKKITRLKIRGRLGYKKVKREKRAICGEIDTVTRAGTRTSLRSGKE